MTDLPLLDKDRLQRLRHDVGPEVLRDLMEDFLAIDYETPLKTLAYQSPQQQKETLHGLKGVAANMGAIALLKACCQLGQHPGPMTCKDQDHLLTVLQQTRQAMRGTESFFDPPQG